MVLIYIIYQLIDFRQFIPAISLNSAKFINQFYLSLFISILLRTSFSIDNRFADYLAIFWYSWTSAKLIPDITEQ